MDPRNVIRRTTLGILVLSVVACGGGAPTDVGDADVDMGAPAATSVAEAPAVDPNDPEAAGAVIYEEAEPVPGTTLGACEIITAGDVQAAFGLAQVVPVGVFEASPTVLSPGHSDCAYEGDFGRVLVSLTPEDGANLYDAAYGAYDGLEVIPGLGDGAFWAADTNRGFVWQDRVTAMISIYAADADVEEIELVTSLGQALIAKL